MALLAAALAPSALADGRNPGSVLVYTIHRTRLNAFKNPDFWTIINVSNRNMAVGTDVSFDYVNVVTTGTDPRFPIVTTCFVTDREEHLTAGDIRSVLTNCHNASHNNGYLVISARSDDPNDMDINGDPRPAWSFNHLMGSEIVVGGSGIMYALNAIPFNAIADEFDLTDAAANGGDDDGRLDFDDNEYEGIGRYMYMDSFIALPFGQDDSSLALINMSGGPQFTATVKFDGFNDNEFPISATYSVRCWREDKLSDIGPLTFTEAYLRKNTPHDPTELDIDCDMSDSLGQYSIQTGWSRIRGLVANSNNDVIMNPVLLGSVTAGSACLIDGGHLLWEDETKLYSGSFLSFSNNAVDD